jgi:hypothetical protein
MSVMRSLGKFSGKMGSNKEFISGVMEGMDPRTVADAVNENTEFMSGLMKNLDPKAMADMVGESASFMADVLQYVDPEAIAQVINQNERILPRFVECINPNVFTRSAGTVFTKLRYATYRPPMFQKPGEAPMEDDE